MKERPLSEKTNYWNMVPFSVYAVINTWLFGQIFSKNLIVSLTIFEFTIFALATYRLADIIANEKVTRVLRSPFMNVIVKDGKEIEVPKQLGLKESIGHLLYCPSCLGVWTAAFFVHGFIFIPTIIKPIALIFAFSGLERLFFNVVGFIKTKAEEDAT